MSQVLHGPMAVLCLPILDLNDLIQAARALTNRVAEGMPVVAVCIACLVHGFEAAFKDRRSRATVIC